MSVPAAFGAEERTIAHSMGDDYRNRYIVIVGPCAAGKSTLRDCLLARGFTQVRVVAQEHSGVRDLWKMRGYPEVLIFLDAEAATANMRQGRSDWTPAAHAEQLHRLQQARAACDLYLPTDELSPDEVADRVEQCIFAKFPHNPSGTPA